MDREILEELTAAMDSGMVQIQSALHQGWLWIGHIFFLPGNVVLAWLIARMPELASFLGIDSPESASVRAAVLSAASWLFLAALGKALYNAIRDFFRSAAFACRTVASAAAYRLRIIRRGILAPVRKIEGRLQRRKFRLLEEFEIDELQYKVLRAQAMRPPGHAITAIEAAEELCVRPLRAQQALSALARLHLMEVSFATSDGCPGYFLTRPGQVYVASCNRRDAASYAVDGVPT